MSIFELTYILLSKVYIFMLLGYVLAYSGLVDLIKVKFILKRIVILFLFPILIFQSTITQLRLEHFNQVIWIILGALCMVFGSFLLTILLYRFGKFPIEKRSFILSGTFHNYGFAVYPIVSALLGKPSLPMTFVFILTCDALFWGLGSFILIDRSKPKMKIPIDQILSPPLIALILAVLMVSLRLQSYIAPKILELMQYPGAMAIPGALACIGGIIFFTLKTNPQAVLTKQHSSKTSYLSLLLLRNLVIPAIGLTLLLWLPLQNELKIIFGIEVAMPSSIGIIFLAGMYQANTRFTAIFSTLSNLISIATVPMLLALIIALFS